MTGIQIGKAIKALLSADAGVTAAVGGKIYPLIATEGTTYPYIVYRRNNTTSVTCKDGRVGDEVNVDVEVASTSYTQGIEIADMVRAALERRTVEIGDFIVHRITMDSASESYIDDAFVQTMNFNILTS